MLDNIMKSIKVWGRQPVTSKVVGQTTKQTISGSISNTYIILKIL